MELERKTVYPVSPEGETLPFFPGVLYTVAPKEHTADEVAQEKIRYLQEENKKLRAEIKALRQVVKNVSC